MLPQYTLTTTVNPAGAGTITPASGVYVSGSQVTVSASANAGYQFAGFTGVDSSNGAVGSVTMNANRSVTANFTSPSFSLSAPQPPSVAPGYSARVTLSATALNGFTGPIRLSYDPAALPGTIYLTFGSFELYPGGSTAVDLLTLNSVTTGTYSVPITGTSGELTHTVHLTLMVAGQPAPPKGPPTAGCTAYATGLSRLTPNLQASQVTGYSVTEVNACAQYFGYYPGVFAALYKGADENPSNMDPPNAAIRIGNGRITANTSATSPDGDVYQLITEHWVQLDIIYRIAVDYYGNSVYRDPLGFSMLPVGGGHGGSGEPASDYYGTYYEYIIYSDLIFLGFTDVIESSSDLEPVITSINPSTWEPGSTVNVTIDGSGFGEAPTLEISPSGGLQWHVDSVAGNGTQILATVTIDSGATPGGRMLAVVSGGSTGLGFVSGPGKSAKSPPKRVTIAGTTCDVTITNDGQSYPLNTNNFRQAQIPLLVTSSCSGSVRWSLTFIYRTTGGRAATRQGPYSVEGALNSIVNFTTAIGVGGRADVVAAVTINGVLTNVPATLFVTGAALPEPTVTAKLKSLYTGPTSALLTGVAEVETKYASGGTFNGQFSTHRQNAQGVAFPLKPVGVVGYWPTESFDGGSHIGLMQVPANVLWAWDWEENAKKGEAVLRESRRIAVVREQEERRPCNGRLPELNEVKREDNALRLYRYGTSPSLLYWRRHPNCREWIYNEFKEKKGDTRVDYVHEVRSNMR